MESKQKWAISDDWVVVILGFFIITAVILGLQLSSPSYTWSNLNEFTNNILTGGNFGKIGMQFIVGLAVILIGGAIANKPLFNVGATFAVIFFITQFALIFAGNSALKSLNLEAVIFSLVIGMLIGNFFTLPDWMKSVLDSEFYVKIGLVLLGTGIIFDDILQAGALGLIQATIVVVSVWYFSFWVCKRLKVEKDMAIMLSSAVSICGVSAAIATAGAIKGDSKKLSYVISLVLIMAIPMMIFLPYIAQAIGLSEIQTGAWLGGTIDTTGAVVASGSLVGEEALKISSIVKFSQNVMLGIAALLISIYWSMTNKTDVDEKPTLKVIWQRFPKFVIGFVAASLLFSFFLAPDVVSGAKSDIKGMRTMWFALAFTGIGLETNISDFLNKNRLKPFYAFSIAQFFNIIVTLIVVYILFS